MSEHLSVNEKYKRPCFAECAKCSGHGVIVLVDGDHSEQILSIEGGKTLLKALVGSGKISEGDAERTEDQLNCSELMPTEEGVNSLVKVLRFASKALQSLCRPSPRKTEEPSDGSESFSA